VGRWRKERLDAGISTVTVAKAYRLLKAIMTTAADDGLIRRNPCRIKGASTEKSPERPVLSIRQVSDLAEAIDPRYQALVLLAVFGSVRWGELAALRRYDIDLEAGIVRVVRQVTELSGGQLVPGPPKSDAGKRLIVLPAAVMPVVRQHMAWLVKSEQLSSLKGRSRVKGGFGVFGAGWACVSGVSCFPGSCRARGELPGGSRTGRSPAAVAAPQASLRRPAGSPMMWRRGTGAGVCGGMRLFRFVPCPVFRCGQCRWLQSSLRVSPAGGPGAWGGRRQR